MKTISQDQFKQLYGQQGVSQFSSTPQKTPDRLSKPLLPAADITQNRQIVKDEGKGLLNTYSQFPGKVVNDISEGAKDISTGFQQGGANNIIGGLMKGTTKTAARLAGDTAGAIYAPIGAAIGTGLKLSGAQNQIDKVGNAVANKVGDNKTLQSFAMSHPNAGEDFGRALNIGLSAGEGGNIEPSTMLERTKAQVKGAVPGNPFTGMKVPNPIEGIKNTVQEYTKASPRKQAQSVDSLENDYYKWQGQTKAGAKLNTKVDAKTDAMNRAGTSGKTPQRILAESGIIPETQGTKFNTADQAARFREKIQPLNEALSQGTKEVDMATTPKPIDELQSDAIQRIKNMNIPEGDRATLVNGVKSEFNLLRDKYGDTVSASEMQREKPNYWGGTKFDSTKPFQGDAYYQVGKSFQKGIEDMASKAGFEDVAQLNREIGDRLEASKYLEKLHGNTLKYGKIGKYAFMAVGSTLGAGPVGKILGALGGEAVGEILMKADVANPVKRMILKSIEQKSPEAYQATLKWLDEQGGLRQTRAQLPPGKALPDTINLPGKGILEGQQKLKDQSRPIDLSNPQAMKKATTDSNIESKNTPSVKKVNSQKGAVKNPFSSIPKDDLGSMRDYIDMVDGSYNPSAEEGQRLTLDAYRLAKRYGGKDIKTNFALANHLEKMIQGSGYLNKREATRGKAGKFTGSTKK